MLERRQRRAGSAGSPGFGAAGSADYRAHFAYPTSSSNGARVQRARERRRCASQDPAAGGSAGGARWRDVEPCANSGKVFTFDSRTGKATVEYYTPQLGKEQDSKKRGTRAEPQLELANPRLYAQNPNLFDP